MVMTCECGNTISLAASTKCKQCAKDTQAKYSPFTVRDVKKYPILSEEVSRAMIDNYIKENK